MSHAELVADSSDLKHARDPQRRTAYLTAAWPAIPRMLAAVDRNPFGPSYGCCDRQYWHYRTSPFPSEMYQEAALPLALAYSRRLPGNRWYGEPRLAEAVVAVLRYSARAAHADGSCDDYYPQERALGAAVFSLQAAVEAYRLLKLEDGPLLRFFERRAEWIAGHDESGRLTNHHALAALALWRTGRLLGRADLREKGLQKAHDVVASQHDEGWYPEYDGADPGYQTVTIDCLARLAREACTGDFDDSLHRALGFSRCFLHPDDSYGGEYGSRGTRHCYPHGLELLAARSADAADLADGFLRSLEQGTAAQFDDDRMFAHRVAGLIEAYVDWSPVRQATDDKNLAAGRSRQFRGAGLLVHQDETRHLIVSTARGGVFHDYPVDGDSSPARATLDAGLVVELADGRRAVSQTHDRRRPLEISPDEWAVADELRESRFERVTPLKQALLHVGMCVAGGWGRTLARRLLQRRVIAGRRSVPVRLERRFRFHRDANDGRVTRIEVIDTVELTDSRLNVRRMALASDLQAAYTAAAQAYQQGLLHPWRDLGEYVDVLNRDRRVVIRRTIA